MPSSENECRFIMNAWNDGGQTNIFEQHIYLDTLTKFHMPAHSRWLISIESPSQDMASFPFCVSSFYLLIQVVSHECFLVIVITFLTSASPSQNSLCLKTDSFLGWAQVSSWADCLPLCLNPAPQDWGQWPSLISSWSECCFPSSSSWTLQQTQHLCFKPLVSVWMNPDFSMNEWTQPICSKTQSHSNSPDPPSLIDPSLTQLVICLLKHVSLSSSLPTYLNFGLRLLTNIIKPTVALRD